jgi:glucokinase
VVYQAPNLHGWTDIPLRDELAARLDLPVLAGNDANFAALGEWKFGAAREFGDLVYLTISTGVGSGFISGGKLVVGHNGLAGEAGHTVLLAGGPVCGCGQRGCFEALASGTAIRADALRRLPEYPDSALRRADPLTAAGIEAEARRGDVLALEVMAQAGRNAGIGVANLVHIFDPDVVVIGGGVSQSGAHWWDALRASARAHVLRAYLPGLRIVPAGLGDDAGLYGAAAAMLDPIAAGA